MIRKSIFVSLMLLGAAFLFVYRLADRDLWSSHEARAAQNAQTILDTGDWLLPRLLDGQPELQKPPMYYWLVAAIGWLRGGTVDPLDVRLPAALAAIGTVLLLTISFRARPIVAVGAALMLATMQHFTWIGRTGRIDMPLTFAVTAAILGVRSNHTLRQVAGYLALALAVMLKGPIGAILPGVVLFAEWIGRARNEKRRSTWLWGIPLVLAITVPWFVAVHGRTNGEFTRTFFWYHHFQRAAGSADTLASHPSWMYLVRLAVDTLPWSPLLIPAAWLAIRTPWLREDATARLGFVWLASVTVLLSFSRFKRADYLLPAYPGMALALGCGLERLAVSRQWQPRLQRIAIAAPLGAAVMVWTVLLHTLIPAMDADRSKSEFAAAVRSLAPAPHQVLMFRVEDHLLGYHLGRPINAFLEWENFDIWAGRPGPNFVVMPAACADRWRQYISSGTLEVLTRYADRTDRERQRDLVLVRTRPNHESGAQRSSAAARFARGDQRADAVSQSGGGADGHR